MHPSLFGCPSNWTTTSPALRLSFDAVELWHAHLIILPTYGKVLSTRPCHLAFSNDFGLYQTRVTLEIVMFLLVSL